MKNKIDYSIYLVTDRDLMSTDTLEEAVEASIKGGCTLVQLREKECSSLDLINCKPTSITINATIKADMYSILP